MTDEKRELITRLTTIVFDKRQRYEAMSLINQQHEPEAARTQSIQFNLARAEFMEAQANLDAAMMP